MSQSREHVERRLRSSRISVDDLCCRRITIILFVYATKQHLHEITIAWCSINKISTSDWLLACDTVPIEEGNGRLTWADYVCGRVGRVAAKVTWLSDCFRNV